MNMTAVFWCWCGGRVRVGRNNVMTEDWGEHFFMFVSHLQLCDDMLMIWVEMTPMRSTRS